MKRLSKYSFASWILYVLLVLCFPVNLFVLLNIIEPNPNLVEGLFYTGWVIWAFGMVLVMAPIVIFPRRGGVAKGKSFVHTTCLVNSGVYAVVRHPQYLGGILSVFLTTPLLYQHWLFVVLGVPGIILVYLGARGEDEHLVEKFGDEYKDYMQSVPRMDIISGIIRLMRRRLVKR